MSENHESVNDESVNGAAAESGSSTPDGDSAAARQLRLRRAPRYRAFGVTGGIVGVVIGLFLALSFSVAGDYSLRSIIGYLAATLGMLGAVLGLGFAVLIERRQVSR